MNELNLKRRKPLASDIFLVLLMLMLYSPFAAITSMSGMVGDTLIQIKIGLDDLKLGTLITDEIYSWHDGLTFTAHESGWYLLLGLMYKAFDLWGVIAVGTIFTYLAGFTALSFMKHTAHPLICAAVIAITPFLGGFPDYNVRPSVTSTFAFALTTVVLLSEDHPLRKAPVIASTAFALGWLHGGILPLYFVLVAVFLVIELIYKRFKDAKFIACGMIVGFVLSLLNPVGISVWTFGLKQQSANDIWAYVDEWKPMEFSIIQLVVILLVFVGFMCKDRIRKFERNAIIKLALLCMFFIASCIYKRFILYYSMMFLMFAPESIEGLLIWLKGNLFPKHEFKKLNLSDFFYKLLSGVCALMLVGVGIINTGNYLPTGSISDIENMAAYDHEVIDFIKEQGYTKLYNSFNTGSWLLFNDIKVHIDNRIDPYMQEYSGVDHIRGKMSVSTLSDLDRFRGEYDNDAFLIETSAGYSDLIYEIETYAPDRYTVVYDNTVSSSIDGLQDIRWLVIECN